MRCRRAIRSYSTARCSSGTSPVPLPSSYPLSLPIDAVGLRRNPLPPHSKEPLLFRLFNEGNSSLRAVIVVERVSHVLPRAAQQDCRRDHSGSFSASSGVGLHWLPNRGRDPQEHDAHLRAASRDHGTSPWHD